MLDNIDPGFGERCCFESYLGKRNETLLVQNRVSFKAMVQRAIFYHEASAAAKHKQMPSPHLCFKPSRSLLGLSGKQRDHIWQNFATLTK